MTLNHCPRYEFREPYHFTRGNGFKFHPQIKEMYHFVSTKSEIKCIYSSVQQSKQQGYTTNYATATLLKGSCQRSIGGKQNILQAGYSSPGGPHLPESGLTSSPSAHAWHCCPLSCFHSGPQQLPAEGFW